MLSGVSGIHQQMEVSVWLPYRTQRPRVRGWMCSSAMPASRRPEHGPSCHLAGSTLAGHVLQSRCETRRAPLLWTACCPMREQGAPQWSGTAARNVPTGRSGRVCVIIKSSSDINSVCQDINLLNRMGKYFKFNVL